MTTLHIYQDLALETVGEADRPLNSWVLSPGSARDLASKLIGHVKPDRVCWETKARAPRSVRRFWSQQAKTQG